MRLRPLQIILWIAATAAVITFLAVRWWPATDDTATADSAFMPTFALADSEGRMRTTAEFRGKFLLVFFGFTSCPDVCPTTLSDISLWLEELGADGDLLVVALITVDPDRDTPDVLADYVSNFDPRIIGLTGSAEQVAKAAADFRVRYARVLRDDGDYTMDHTAGVFLFHPDGRFASIIDFHEDRRFAVPKIRRTLS